MSPHTISLPERKIYSGRSDLAYGYSDADLVLRYTLLSFAPPLGDHGPSLFVSPYHDQDAWYSDCILANRLSSDYILVLDSDEFPMLKFDISAEHSLSRQWGEFLDSLPPDKGVFEMTRIPMSGDVARGPPNPSNLIQDELRCSHGTDDKVKSFYRAESIMTTNQHKKTASRYVTLQGPFKLLTFYSVADVPDGRRNFQEA